MDKILDELGSFTLIGFSDGSLVFTMVVSSSRQCPVHPESAILSFACGFCGDIVLLLVIV